MVNCGYAVRFYDKEGIFELVNKEISPSPTVHIRRKVHVYIIIYRVVSIGSCYEENAKINQQMEIISLR